MSVNVKSFSKSKESSGSASGTSSGALVQKVADVAKKLSETHYIFGQPYNGTNDVSGDMSNVHNIVASGDVTIDGDYVIKGFDEDGNYSGNDLRISKEVGNTQITGGEEYVFDGFVQGDKFIGDVEAENLRALFTDIDNLSAREGTIIDLSATKALITEILADNISVENLTVTKAAHFFSLIIDEIKSVGGQIILSPANATLDMVKETSSGNYKCYFRAQVGDDHISNHFLANDLVVCQTFNVAEGTYYDVSNKFYWRRMISKGRETIDDVDYHYILLSGSDCDENSGIPQEGDKIVTLGNTTTADRQNAIVLSAYNSQFLDPGIKAPSMVQYTGINEYDLSNHRMNVISKDLNIFKGDFHITTGESVTDMIQAQAYERMVIDKAIAVVSAEDKLKLYLQGSIKPIGSETYTLVCRCTEIHSGTNIAINNNSFSYTNEQFMANYSKASSKPTYFSLDLMQGSKVVQDVQIPVTFEAGAVFNVTNNAISAAVQDINGDIARVELKADNVTTRVDTIEGDYVTSSELTVAENRIEGKIVSEETINSLISQSGEEIKAEVYDDLNQSTGIDIVNGSITLNANKTTINGNLNIRNSDDGLIIFNDDGQASVIIQNKQIPTIANLDQPINDYGFSSNINVDYGDESDIVIDTDNISLGKYKSGDTLIIGSNLLLYYIISATDYQSIPLSSTEYYTYQYVVVNTTTHTEYRSTIGRITQTGSPGDGGNYLGEYTLNITKAGEYEAYLLIHLMNKPSTTYYIGANWDYYITKQASAYTQIGTDGMVSVRDENKYLYFGDDGFIVRQGDYNGLNVSGSSVKQLIGYTSENDSIWGGMNALYETCVNPTPVLTRAYAGDTSLGNRYVVDLETNYVNCDLIVIQNADNEIYLKLPSLIYVNGHPSAIKTGRSIKVKNYSGKPLTVFIEDVGRMIVSPNASSTSYQQNVGYNASEFIFDGTNWLWFRCN